MCCNVLDGTRHLRVTDIPGLEVAGVITEVGADVERWKVGDRVCALLAGGGYAEYCVAPAVQCLPVPSGYTLSDAAALPEVLFTVWSNVFDRGRLQAGSRCWCTAVRVASAPLQFSWRVHVVPGCSPRLAAKRSAGRAGTGC